MRILAAFVGGYFCTRGIVVSLVVRKKLMRQGRFPEETLEKKELLRRKARSCLECSVLLLICALESDVIPTRSPPGSPSRWWVLSHLRFHESQKVPPVGIELMTYIRTQSDSYTVAN